MARKRNRLTLQFSGFAEYAERLDELGGNLKEVTEKALKESHAYVTPKLVAAMAAHRRSGDTEKSIVWDSPVEWEGSTAGIKVGFDLKNGGMPSILLMYGTPRHAPDADLYNAIYGNKAKREVGKLQKEIFAEEIRKCMEG